MLVSVCPQVRLYLSSYPHLFFFSLDFYLLASSPHLSIPFPLSSNSYSLHFLLLSFPTSFSSGCVAISHNYSKNNYSFFVSVPRRDHVSPPPSNHETHIFQYTPEAAVVGTCGSVWSLGACFAKGCLAYKSIAIILSIHKRTSILIHTHTHTHI